MSGISNAPIIPLIDTLHLSNIDDAEYFSKYEDYISNSRLGLIDPSRGGSPKRYFNKEYDSGTRSLSLGSVIHQLFLQPESYQLVDTVDAPTAKAGLMADYLYRYGKVPSNNEIVEASNKLDYFKGKMDEKKIKSFKDKVYNYWMQRSLWEEKNTDKRIPIFLDPKGREIVHNCMASLNKNQDLLKCMNPDYIVTQPDTYNEQTILLDISIEDRIYHLKGKLDNFVIDYDTNTIIVNDLKTIYKPVEEIQDNVDRFAYGRELAIYSWLLSLVANKYYGMTNSIIKGNLLVVQTKDNFDTCIYPITKKLYIDSFHEFKYLVKLVDYFTAIEPYCH